MVVLSYSLRSIIKVLKLCGRQNLALRGHREKGDILDAADTSNGGNFRALLRERAEAGDEILREHLQSCGANATYISPDVQNQLVHECGKIIKVTDFRALKI